MDSLVIVAKIFLFNPLAALFIAGALVSGAFRPDKTTKQKRTLFLTAGLWGLYAVWEMFMLSWRSPSGDHAIRVDLVFLMPVLLISGAIGGAALLQGQKNK